MIDASQAGFVPLGQQTPYRLTCDWYDDRTVQGACVEPTVGFRFTEEDGWLTCCAQHSGVSR